MLICTLISSLLRLIEADVCTHKVFNSDKTETKCSQNSWPDVMACETWFSAGLLGEKYFSDWIYSINPQLLVFQSQQEQHGKSGVGRRLKCIFYTVFKCAVCSCAYIRDMMENKLLVTGCHLTPRRGSLFSQRSEEFSSYPAQQQQIDRKC